MGKVDKELAIEMRREGRSFTDIADYFGVSRQAIAHMLGNSVRARKECNTIDIIPYKGLYEFMDSHKKLTIERLAKIAFGYSKHATSEKIRRFLRGENVCLPKFVYDNLIAHTGMTYEQLFAPREDLT